MEKGKEMDLLSPQVFEEPKKDDGRIEITYLEKENPNQHKVTKHFSTEILDDLDFRCGIGNFSPEWLQVFASKKAFMLIFSLLSVVQGMSWSYFTATITTLEKRFKISSRTAGIVMTGNELSQIMFALLLSYYGSKGHRPRWIASGVVISAIGAIILASPHFFYGPGDDALSLTREYADQMDSDYTSTTVNPLMNSFNQLTSTPNPNPFVKNETRVSKIQLCDRFAMKKDDTCNKNELSIVPLVLIFISQFVTGIGVLLFYTLGGPYMDDNIKKTKSPIAFGITMSLRLVGPTLGYLFASACLKIYIAPYLTPIIRVEDPRWLGAWWLGWVILGFLMLFTAIFIGLFPRELPRALQRKRLMKTMDESPKGMGGFSSRTDLGNAGSQLVLTSDVPVKTPGPKLSEIPGAVLVLLKNKTNLFNNLASIFYVFSAIGYWTYMPKYMETIFMQTAVNAAAISGIVSILFQAIGLLASGFFISKYQPSARKLAGWNVFIGFLYVIVIMIFTQVGCDPGKMNFGEEGIDGGYNLTNTCNSGCSCKVNKILPFCHKASNQVFYSACHAGCTNILNETHVTDCSCLSSPTEIIEIGTCSEGCRTTFVTFLAVNAFMKLIDSSGRIGNMLVSYRCIDPRDKSLSIGLTIFLMSIFAFLPSPILFGYIIDSVCMVWGTKCGQKGNCWLYDGARLRYLFNATAAVFLFLAAVFDSFVFYYVKDLDLYDEEKNVAFNKAKEERKKAKKSSPS